MMNVFTKGMSFNVTLSNEQMIEIASITAEKVNLTRDYHEKQMDWQQREIDGLRSQIAEREKLITLDLISKDRYRNALRKANKTIESLRAEILELKKENEHA